MKHWKKLFSLSLACLLAVSATACAQQDQTPTESSLSGDVSQTVPEDNTAKELQKVLEDSEFKGIAYITKNGKVLLSKSTGTSDKTGKNAVNENTLFRIASNSKQFTAAAIMLLVQEGKLSVSKKISTYFPSCSYGSKVTIHQLLCMRSGIPDYITLKDGKLPFAATQNASAAENKKAIEEYILSRELSFKPGVEMEYSNSNYFLLARIVEIVSGMSYEDYLTEKFFKPLQMTQTGFADTFSGELAEEMAVNRQQAYLLYPGMSFGAGSIISNVHDLNLWLNSLTDYPILSKEVVTDMAYSNSNPGDALQYGYGLMIDASGNAFFHTGTLSAYSSMLYVNQVTNTKMILLSNYPGKEIEAVGTGLINYLPLDFEASE